MKAGKAVLALSLVLAASVAYPPGALACDGVDAHRVEERPPGMYWGSRDLIAIGDFDGDGSVDKAFFMEKSGTLLLRACLDGGGRLVTVLEVGGIGALAHNGIKSVPRGTHATPCARGLGPDCGPGPLAQLELDHEAIEFMVYEKFSFLLYWSAGAWKRIPWSD